MSLFKVTITKTAEVYVEAPTHLFAEEKVQRILMNDDVYLEWQEDDCCAEFSSLSEWVNSLDSGYYITAVQFNDECHLIPGKIEDIDDFNENDDCTDLLWEYDDERELRIQTDVYIVGNACCPSEIFNPDDPDWDIVNDNIDELLQYAELDSTNHFVVPNPYYEDSEDDEEEEESECLD